MASFLRQFGGGGRGGRRGSNAPDGNVGNRGAPGSSPPPASSGPAAAGPMPGFGGNGSSGSAGGRYGSSNGGYSTSERRTRWGDESGPGGGGGGVNLDGLCAFVAEVKSLASLALVSLVACGLVTLLLLLSATIRPFSKPTYRRLSASLAASAFLDASALLVPNTAICLTGDSDVPSPVGASVLVCNHLMNGDWWAVLMLGRCVGLRGSIKVFLRNEVLQGRDDAKFAPARGDSGAVVSNGGGGSSHALNRTYSSPLSHSNAGGGSPPNGNSVAAAGPGSSGGGNGSRTDVPVLVKLGGYLLHSLLEFPLLSSESSQNWVRDRSDLLTLLRSFAEGGAPAPVHLLLFPEGWSLEGKMGGERETDRRSVMAKSVEFAKREGRPQLKHLLLPRTTGFNASLESLRESSPVVYDVTMAYRGYDGSVPMSLDLSWPSLWAIVRGEIPSEIHFRIKRYSMEEVVGDAQWLDKQWAEKDRLLSHFSKYQQFPVDPRGFCRHRVMNTRSYCVESSVIGLSRLGLVPFAIPVILLLSIPLCWAVLWLWLAYRAFDLVFPDWDGISSLLGGVGSLGGGGSRQTPRSAGNGGVDSVVGTPFFPATPFASPNQHLTSWRTSSDKNEYKDGDSPARR